MGLPEVARAFCARPPFPAIPASRPAGLAARVLFSRDAAPPPRLLHPERHGTRAS